MAKFILTYHAPEGYQPGSPDAVAAWQGWFQDMGEQVADIGQPISRRQALGNVAEGTQLGGYSIVTADDLDAAAVLAKGCPFLQHGGGVQVGQLEALPG